MNDRIAAAGLRVHALAETFPMICGEALIPFQTDIQLHGLRQPIVYSWDGVLVDGRNRLNAWLYCGRSLETIPSITLDDDVDLDAYIISINIARRQMSTAQKALAAARAMPYYSGRHGGDRTQDCNPAGLKGESAELAGAAFGVGSRNVYSARKLLDYPQFAKQVDEGSMNIQQALKALADSRESTHDESYLRAENVKQPERETTIGQSEILAWFRLNDYEQAAEVLALATSLMQARANSVTPSPFTTDEKTAQQITKALEIADIRSNNSKDNAHA